MCDNADPTLRGPEGHAPDVRREATMPLRARIAALVAAAPAGATVPVAWLAELLALDAAEANGGDAGHARHGGSAADVTVDLTVPQLAERFERGESTIRGWLAAGAFPGAYRLHGREWRIPAAAVEAMQRAAAAEAERGDGADAAGQDQRASATPDLGEWRKHLPRPPTARLAR